MVGFFGSLSWADVDWGDVPTWLTGIFAVPAVIAAGLQVRHAAKQNERSAEQEELAAKQLEDGHRPIVIASLEPSPASDQIIDFSVRNVGRGPAYDVKFEFLDLPEVSDLYADSPFWEVQYLTAGIPVMGPGEDRRTIADVNTHRANARKHVQLKEEGCVRISYQSVNGREHQDKFSFNFYSHKGSYRAVIKTPHDMAKALEEIVKALKKKSP